MCWLIHFLTLCCSFMWSFEKIHRCLAHLFLGQLVTTFDEEFRILFAHSEPLVVENVLANMPHYGGEPESYYNTEKSHMFNRQHTTMGRECAGHTTEDHLKLGNNMLPFRSESLHSATEANPSVQRHMNLHAAQQYRGDSQFIDHGRQMRGPNETVGFKRHSCENIHDYEYMPPQNHPTMRGNQYMEGAMPQGGHFSREPHIYQGTGLQSDYDMYGRFTGQGQHIDQFSGPVYPHEGDEAEPPGAYDHIQRYLQSQPAMEEGHGPRNVLSPVQSNLKTNSMGQSYKCQTSPTHPNPPEQKRFFNAIRKPQDVSQKQGLRDWRISSYLSAYDDAGELDLAELEGSTLCDDIPCFTQEAPCGPVRAEIRPGKREFNRIPSPRENPTFFQIQNDSIVPDSLANLPSDLSQIIIKTTPASTSESSCTTEGDKADETQNREPKETNRISEEFLKRKPSRPVQRSSRLRHSLIFSSNLELHMSEEMKDTAAEKDGDEASKLSARVSQILDKRRTGSPFQPFQWSNFAKSATFDNSISESAQPEDELKKIGENSDLDKVETCQNVQNNSLKGDLQEKDQPQPVPKQNSQRDECPSNLLQKPSSFIDMNDPDCRLRYFKELAAKRKLAAAKTSQSNPMKATQTFTLPEKPLANDADKKTGPVFKSPDTPLKSKNTPATVTEIKETYKDTKCEESSKDILHRATDAEKIRFKKKLAEEFGSTCKNAKGDIDQAFKSVEEARTVSTSKNQTPHILNIVSQKPLCALQNQVDSVALDTTSTESGLNQYHIPKEIDPSHAVLTEGCPPVKLPLTKCVSPLRTTPNEGSPSAKDSQILAQSLTNISSTCSDTVPLGSSSTPNLAIVDTCVPSKNDHINTVPSPACPKTRIYSTEHHNAIKADSSQHFNETGADLSRHFTKVGAEPSTAENVHSQHHSETEKNSSQQYTLMEADSSISPTTTESEPSQKSTSTEAEWSASTEADHSQHTTTSKTDCFQQPTAVKKDFFLHPTPTECGTSQNIPITTETDSFQQPTLAKSESSNHSASSQQPTETGEDSSQPPTKTGTDFCQQSSAAESRKTDPTTARHKSSQPYTAVSSDFSKHPPAVGADTSEQLTAAEMDSSQLSAASVEDSMQHNVAKESKHPLKPTASGTQPFIQPNASAAGSLQHSSAMETDSCQQPTAKAKDSSQHPTATATDSSQQPTTTTTGSTLQPTITITDSSQQPAATDIVSSRKPAAADKVSSQKSISTGTDFSDTDSSQQPTVTVTNYSGTDSSQQPTSTVTDSSDRDSSQQPTATITDVSQQPSVTVTYSSDTDSSQQPTATFTDSLDTDSSQQPTVTVTDSSDTDSSQQPTATVTDSLDTDSSQQPTVTVTDSSDTDSSQQPTVTVTDSLDTDSSQHPIVAVSDSSQQPNPIVTDSPQQPTATVTDSSQQPTATVTCSSQEPIATVTDSSQQPTVTVTGSSQQPTATVSDSSQQPTVTVTGSSQQPTVTVTGSSQQPTVTVTGSSQQPTVTVTGSSKQPTVTVSDSSQQPTVTVTGSSQQPTATVTDSSQQPTATVTDSSQQPTATVTDYSDTDSSQQPTAAEIDPSREPTAADTNTTQKSTSTVTDSSQQPSATETDSSPEATAAITDTSQKSTATDTDSSQQTTARLADSSQLPAATTTDSFQQSFATDADSSQQPAAKTTHFSQTHTVTATDSFQLSIPTETDLSQQLTIPESEFSQNPKMETDTSKHPIKTENESLQDITATKSDCVNEKKDDNLSEAFSKLIPILEANITQKDNSTSQNAVITDLSSPAEHFQSDIVTPCDSQVELNQTQACITHTVKDTDNGALTRLDSMEVSSTQPQGSPKPCLSSDEIDSTQGITHLQSSLSSNPMESSYQKDSKPEKTDGCQTSDTIAEQTESHDTPAVDARPQIEVSTAIDSNGVDKMKQTTPEIENTVTNIEEVSEKSHLTVQSHSENQSSVAENANSIVSAHQTSTAHVISCSNLRDDTKVLLEQISAKHRSRSSLPKQTLAAPNEAKKAEVSSADKLFSNYSGRPWSSKTTPEEREMLLQKMEQMRKDRKVYSRFEVCCRIFFHMN